MPDYTKEHLQSLKEHLQLSLTKHLQVMLPQEFPFNVKRHEYEENNIWCFVKINLGGNTKNTIFAEIEIQSSYDNEYIEHEIIQKGQEGDPLTTRKDLTLENLYLWLIKDLVREIANNRTYHQGDTPKEKDALVEEKLDKIIYILQYNKDPFKHSGL